MADDTAPSARSADADAQLLILRVFLSSPGDVADERSLARRVLVSLPQEPQFQGRVFLEEVSWDNPNAAIPMPAHLTPQEAINTRRRKPSQCDVVLVIVWSRMGTPLPADYKKADGGRYQSGTEWEYLDALERAEREGKPLVLVYQRTEKVLLDPDSPDFAESMEQRRKVQEFFATFRSADGSIRRSFLTYDTPSTFANLVQGQLREIVWQRLEEMGIARGGPAASADARQARAVLWQRSPFPGLRAFAEDESQIFFGRGHETDGLIRRLGANRFVAVIGPSGSGKSSLVMAGLLPRLKEGAIGGSAGWHVLRFTPGEVGDDPFMAIGVRLAAALPHGGKTARDFADALRSNSGALDSIADELLVEREPAAQLLLLVDQFEELFTLVAEKHRADFVKLIAAAARAERLRTVLTLRADFYSHCAKWELIVALLREGSYLLGAPGVVALTEMVTQPAQAAGLEFEDGLVDRILADTGTDPGALALMEFLLSRLYEKRVERKLTTAAYEELGGVAGAIDARAEAAVRPASGDLDSDTLGHVFQELVSVDADGATTRRRAILAEMQGAPRVLVDKLVEARLLVTSGSEDTATVEVAHEAVLRHWKRLAQWVDANRGFLLWRRRLAADASDWERAQRDPDNLLYGAHLEEARRWLRARGDALLPDEVTFIRASERARWRRIATGVGGVLTIGALFGIAIVEYRAWAARQPIVPQMVEVKAGQFEMGSPDTAAGAGKDEHPQHTVQFAKGFLIGVYEVTFDEYVRCVNAKYCNAADGVGREPVHGVSWNDATNYVKWLARTTRKPFRLLTEAEWEYAARAGTQTAYWWGDEVGKGRATCKGCGGIWEERNRAAPVGSFNPNAWGLYDTVGNVWEWVQDCRHNSYKNAPTDGSAWEEQGRGDCRRRVFRGGSWFNEVGYARSAARYTNAAGTHHSNVGFRVAQDLP